MKITFVTESHAFGDEKQSVDVAGQKDLNDVSERMNARIGDEVARAECEIGKHAEWIHGHTEWIRAIEKKVNEEFEAKVNALPNTLLETLKCAWEKTFAEKFALGEQVVAHLQQASEHVEAELAEVRRASECVSAELAEVRRARECVSAELAEVRHLHEEMKHEVEKRQKFSLTSIVRGFFPSGGD